MSSGRAASPQSSTTSSSTTGAGGTSTPAPEKRKVEESPLSKVTRDRFVFETTCEISFYYANCLPDKNFFFLKKKMSIVQKSPLRPLTV